MPAPVLALLLLLPQAAARVPSSDPTADRVGVVQRLALPRAVSAPDTFDVEVRFAGERRRLVLRRHALRAPDARVRVWGADGLEREVAAPPSTVYRGSVAGEPGSVVLASFFDGELTATVHTGRPEAPGWTIEPAADGSGRYAVREVDHAHPEGPAEAFCGVRDFAPHAETTLPFRAAATPRDGRCLKLCEIAFDADFEYYQLKGSSVPGVIAAIDAIMNQVDYFYARDVLITYALTGYVVRTAPFYTPSSGGDLLDQFRAEWNANQTVSRDIAHLMTDKGRSSSTAGWPG